MQIFCIFIQNNKFKMGLKIDSPKNNGAPQAKPCAIRLCLVWGAFSLSCLSVKGLFHSLQNSEKSKKIHS